MPNNDFPRQLTDAEIDAIAGGVGGPLPKPACDDRTLPTAVFLIAPFTAQQNAIKICLPPAP